MNPADLARLELAKRAYRAAEPRNLEVRHAVRKLRLALRKPPERRIWFTKTLVVVVLAVGSLAYAKPQVLGEFVARALRVLPSPHGRAPGPAAPTVTPVPRAAESARAQAGSSHAASGATLHPAAGAPAAEQRPSELLRPSLSAPKGQTQRAAVPSPERARSSGPAQQLPRGERSMAKPSSSDPGHAGASAPGSDWGRVGAALARGDETLALAVLDQLAESGDPRTRDNADLGRAQLLLSSGDSEGACRVARSLTNRGAGARVARQAQALSKNCERGGR